MTDSFRIGSLYFRLMGRARKYRDALLEELREQVGMARDQGVALTHLNGHQYVELLAGRSITDPRSDAAFRDPWKSR
ncbi:MAG: hypothetical protein U0903_06090 [Planctomycetales bacterium]